MLYITDFFQEKLRVPVEYLNTFSAITIAETVDKEALQAIAPMFQEMIGMSLRSVTQCPIDISLIPASIRNQVELNRKKPYFYGTGRRKSSVARVHLFPNGTGSITINGRDIDDYFGLETLKLLVRQPLVTTEQLGKVDIVATVTGGGVTGQAGAIRHGVARALLLANEEYRPALKAAGFLTRDPRMKERKKYGLKAARRAPQFSKR